MTDEERREQEMMRVIADFMLMFRQRFGDGLKITVKPINKKRRWIKKE